MTMRWCLLALACLALGCATTRGPADAARGKLITPSEQDAQAAWTESERDAPLVMRNLRRSPEASFHLLRVKGQRDAHMHASSDLSVFMLAGELEFTIEGRSFTITRGDVLEVPRGTGYALRNMSSDASVAYLVFTPALAADDDKSAAPPPRESAWRWNLWVQ
jgi:mannose-6-phosphate isomerase-like protein (cupin superfamily)